MRDLIEELIVRKQGGTLAADSALFEGDTTTLSESTIAAIEERLGFLLHPVLRRIYGGVANGGFGPAYGLLGLRGGMTNEIGNDAESLYEVMRQSDPDDPLWAWPKGLMPAFHLGCGMYLCVDCTDHDGAIVCFEPNPHEPGESWDSSFIPFSISLTEMLLEWIDGKDPFDRFIEPGSEEDATQNP